MDRPCGGSWIGRSEVHVRPGIATSGNHGGFPDLTLCACGVCCGVPHGRRPSTGVAHQVFDEVPQPRSPGHKRQHSSSVGGRHTTHHRHPRAAQADAGNQGPAGSGDSSPSTTTTTPPPTEPIPAPATPEEARTRIESAMGSPLQCSVVPELAMPAPTACSTECRDVLSKQCEAASACLACTYVIPVQEDAVLPATTQPPTLVDRQNRCNHTQRPGVPLTASMVPSVRVPPHPPDRRCTDASIGVVATLCRDKEDMMMLEQNNLTDWGESAIQDNGLLGKYNYDFDSSQSLAMSLGSNKKRPVLIIQGQPGTGKTGLLSYLIDYAVRQGKRVLVTAPSNAAVNNMVEKLSCTRSSIVRVANPARISPSVSSKSLGEVVKRSTNCVVQFLMIWDPGILRYTHAYTLIVFLTRMQFSYWRREFPGILDICLAVRTCKAGTAGTHAICKGVSMGIDCSNMQMHKCCAGKEVLIQEEKFPTALRSFGSTECLVVQKGAADWCSGCSITTLAHTIAAAAWGLGLSQENFSTAQQLLHRKSDMVGCMVSSPINTPWDPGGFTSTDLLSSWRVIIGALMTWNLGEQLLSFDQVPWDPDGVRLHQHSNAEMQNLYLAKDDLILLVCYSSAEPIVLMPVQPMVKNADDADSINLEVLQRFLLHLLLLVNKMLRRAPPLRILKSHDEAVDDPWGQGSQKEGVMSCTRPSYQV